MTAQETTTPETTPEVVEDAPSKKKFTIPAPVKKAAIWVGAGIALVGVTVIATLAATSQEDEEEDLYLLEATDDLEPLALETPTID